MMKIMVIGEINDMISKILRIYFLFLFQIYILICVSDIYFDDGRRAGMKNEIRVRPW